LNELTKDKAYKPTTKSQKYAKFEDDLVIDDDFRLNSGGPSVGSKLTTYKTSNNAAI
jgi:hypothetical protein